MLMPTSALLAATSYWDSNGANSGLGGAGTWQDAAGNWSSDLAGETTTVWTNAARDTADFRGTAGAVTLSGTVSAEQLLFNSGGYTLSGGDLTIGRSSGSGNFTLIDVQSGTGTTTLNSGITIDDAGSVASNAIYTIDVSAASSSLVLDGNLTLDHASGTPGGTKTFGFLTGDNTASIYVNGSILGGTNSGTMALEFGTGGSNQSQALALNGTFYVNGDNSDVTGNSRIHGGTVYVGHDNALGSGKLTFGSSGARGDMKLLTNGAVTISNDLSMSGGATSQTYIGGVTADDSTYSGDFNMNAFGSSGSPGTISTPNAIFTAAAGGRVNFSGNVRSTSSVPRGLKVEGDGIIAFTRAAGNEYKGVTEINSGTLLLMNTSGSATGDASQLVAGESGVIIASGARLGGTGITTVLVEASAAGSIISAGDMTKEGARSIGTLHLDGGMKATSGASFEVDINGASIDVVDFGTADVDLDGLLTFDFESLGTVNVGITYSLFAGTGDWTGSDATFAFNSPDGYVLDSGYGSGNGYIWDAVGNSLTIQFSAIPEPGAYALLAGWLGLTTVMLHRRR